MLLCLFSVTLWFVFCSPLKILKKGNGSQYVSVPPPTFLFVYSTEESVDVSRLIELNLSSSWFETLNTKTYLSKKKKNCLSSVKLLHWGKSKTLTSSYVEACITAVCANSGAVTRQQQKPVGAQRVRKTIQVFLVELLILAYLVKFIVNWICSGPFFIFSWWVKITDASQWNYTIFYKHKPLGKGHLVFILSLVKVVGRFFFFLNHMKQVDSLQHTQFTV